VAYRSFGLLNYNARGVRKVTTGITGLWLPSVKSVIVYLVDAANWITVVILELIHAKNPDL